MKKILSILPTLALAAGLAVTALAAGATAPTVPPEGDDKVVTLEDMTERASKGTLYLEFSESITRKEETSDVTRITVPAGTTVTVYWFRDGKFMPISSNNDTCVLELFDVDYKPAKSAYNADGTVSFLLEKENSVTNNWYDLEAYTNEGMWKFEKELRIYMAGSASSTGTDWKANDLSAVVAVSTGGPGGFENYSTLSMRFDHGIDNYAYHSDAFSTVVEVPTGTTISMSLWQRVDYDTWNTKVLQPAGDFSFVEADSIGGNQYSEVIGGIKVTPTTSTSGNSSLFSFNQPGDYLLQDKRADGYPWILVQRGIMVIHVTGSAVNSDPGTGLPPILPPFMDSHEGYMSGYPDGTIRPNGTVTRAEMVSIIFRLLEDGVRASHLRDENAYSDVNRGSWYNTAISTIADLDYISGYGDGTFRPDQPITRAEVASIIARFVGHATGPVTASSFSDVDDQSWYADAVNFVKSKGWMVGDSGKFRPNDAITRAEVMATMNRVLGRSPSKDSFLLVKDDSKFTQWPDNRNKSVWYYADVQEATHSHNYMAFSKGGSEVWTEIVRMRDWSVYSY